MTTEPTPTVARLDLARDHLAEARRYVASRPADARQHVEAARRVLIEVINGLNAADYGTIAFAIQCAGEIVAALDVSPDAARGGIDVARYALGRASGEIRVRAERARRDQELAEAYAR